MNCMALTELERMVCEVASQFPGDLQGLEIPSRALQALAQALDCTWATYWKVDAATSTLRAAVCWSTPEFFDVRLRAHTLGRQLSMSEGTAGHVWRSRKPICTVNLAMDMCLPRSLDAAHAGLHAGVWFAVKADREVFGVVELLGRSIPEPTDELLAATEHVGLSLGALLVGPEIH